jgi:hypothetical protein
MEAILNILLKRSGLMHCPCAPGVVTEVLERVSTVTPSDPELSSDTLFDPVLAVRLRRFQAAADSSAALADPAPLLRAMLLTAPVAEGVHLAGYAERWRTSLKVAVLTRALAERSGLVTTDLAWLAGLTHNLAAYLPPLASVQMEASIDAVEAETSAAWLTGLDEDGWLADAARYHALPLHRSKTAHPLIRMVQLGYVLATRPQAVDSVDVRVALTAMGIGAAEGISLLSEAHTEVQRLAQRFGLADAQLHSQVSGYSRLARTYANQAARSELHTYLSSADQIIALQQALQGVLRILFGVERICLFVPQANGTLKVSPMFDPPAALTRLVIAQDDGHSVLSLALTQGQALHFDGCEAEFSVMDAQIARVLGVDSYLCQPVTIGSLQPALLLCGDMPHSNSQLWRDFVTEWAAAHARLNAPVQSSPAPADIAQADTVLHDRVRRAIHEVANPLTIMRNYVNLLSARSGTDTSVQRDLTIISEEIERVARIVRGITARDDSPAATSTELTSVNTLISELVRMTLGTLLAPNKISVQIDLNPEVQPMPLHKDQLKQVLFNLAKNAVEAMTQGGHLSFSTRLINSGGKPQVEIEIADTGPGLPEHIRQNPFETTGSQKGGDHAGLGLPISHKLITRMGGSIDYETSNLGTRFLIRLPNPYAVGQQPPPVPQYGTAF